LSWETVEDSLIAHCASYGINVAQCEVARQHSGRSKGWALIDFGSADEAANAIEQLHDSELESRAIIVRVERPAGGVKPADNLVRVERIGNSGQHEQKSGGGPARPESSSGLQIIVRSLPWSTTDEELLGVFEQIGSVVSANVQCHADTGRSKGWGTVRFETAELAQAAVNGFNGVVLGDRPMQIKLDRYE
jgi:RNA recognition motif-containing protein